MERPWLILCRVARVAPPGAHADAEEHAADMDDVEMQHAAVGEAEDHVAAVDAAAEAQAQEGGYAAAGDADEEEDAQAQHAADGEEEAEEDPQAQLEERVVNVNTDAVASEAAHAARGAAEPDFIVSVAPPPRVSSLVAGLNSHPDPARPDMYPYIVASGRFCLLVHFAVHPFHGTYFCDDPSHSHLVVVRHFRRAGGQVAACAVRVPGRPRYILPLSNVECVGLVCNNQTGDYKIAELEITRNCLPTFVRFDSALGVWESTMLPNPLDEDDELRRWVPHGTVAINSTVVWFDLSWGIISCNLDQESPDLVFHRLPRGSKLRDGAGATPDLHSRRCISISENLVRYVEITMSPHQAAKVRMWYRDVENNPAKWIANYEVSFADIWVDDSYIQTGLPRNPPVLVGVSPVNSNVIYFTLEQRLFGVNVPEHKVVGCEGYEQLNGPGPPDELITSRYLITWNLEADQAINIGHQPEESSDHGDSSDNGPLDEGEIDYQSRHPDHEDSSSSSNNGTMEEGEIEYQSP